MGISTLWAMPEVNPVNKKARSIPLLNPITNVYGRVFFFAWFGFFMAFWTWFAFPPLLSDIIAKDLGISTPEVQNSNIIGLAATLIVRLIAGPACDRFGPRKTFVGCLLIGVIPGFCSGGIQNASGLYAVRFFVGILGGSFVPCQVWTTGFFDKNTVGFANSLAAGFGNAGGGVTYFVMPAVYNSLVSDGLSADVAWRVTFVVPSFLILITAIATYLLTPDTPIGRWEDRHIAVENSLRKHNVVEVPGAIMGSKAASEGSESPERDLGRDLEKKEIAGHGGFVHEHEMEQSEMIETAKGETVAKPTFKSTLKVMLSPQTMVMGATYFCNFGTELAVNGILGGYYMKSFNTSLQDSGNWAAMFGLLNVVFRPLGGYMSDRAYIYTGRNLWAKKALISVWGVVTGAFMVAIGVLNSKNSSTVYGLVAGLAIFLEGGNGLVFSLVPHVSPHANGVVSGVTGAAGNLGGIVFAIIFRYASTQSNAFWYIGVIVMAVHLSVSWIRPVPKNQIGGR